MARIVFNNFLGGIADDQEALNQGTAALLQNFNIHERPPYLVSNNVVTKFTDQSSFTSPVVWIGKSPITTSSDVYLMRQDGKRMLQTNGAGTFSVDDIGATTITRAISGVASYNNNNTNTTCFIITCFSNGAIEAVDLQGTPTVVALRASGTEGPVYWFKKAGKVYAGNGNTLDSISGSTPSLTSAVLTLQKDDHIYHLDEFGNYLAIFVQARGQNKRYLYLWDTFSDGINAVFEIPEEVSTGNGIASRYFEGVLYFLLGQPVCFYGFDGASIKRIWRFPRNLSQVFVDTTIDVYPNAMDVFDGRLFFGLGNGTSGNANSLVGLWSYGQRDVKYPKAVTLELLNNGVTTRDTGVTAVQRVATNLYLGIYDGTTYEVGYLGRPSSGVNKSNGVAESLWIDPVKLGIGMPGDQFQIMRAGIMTLPLDASTSATLKIKYDYDSTAYSSVTASVTHSTSSDTFMATDVSGNLFRKFQFRIDTTAATTSAPTITGVFFDIEPRSTFGSA